MASRTFLLILVDVGHKWSGFRDELLSIQKLQPYFISVLWLKAMLFVANGPSTFVKFIEWVRCK